MDEFFKENNIPEKERISGEENTAEASAQAPLEPETEKEEINAPETAHNENEEETVGAEPEAVQSEEYTDNSGADYSANYSQNDNNFTPVYNPVSYSPVNPVGDYKPMSRGLKVFAVIMAAIILLTGTCYAGYVIGKSSVSFGGSKNIDLNLAAAPKDTDEMTAAEVYEEVNKSIVGIRIYNSSSNGGQASGIIFSKDGYIVTNDHIYADIAAAKFVVYTYDGKEYEAEYVAGDQVSDLAVLKIDADGFTPATFGNSDELYYGQNVVAIGRPSDATDNSSITRGVISALNRRVQTTSSYSSRLIQTDSAINPGSSGGALVNMYGQVVGVTSSKIASSDYDAVGYAIPTTVMKRIVDELIEHGEVVSRAKLGVSYTAIDSITAEIGGYDVIGLLVASVAEDSDLYGKVNEGDFITHINGVEITDDDMVLDIIEQSAPGDTVTVTVYTSSGKTQSLDVELKANVSESSYTVTDSSSGNFTESNGNSNGSENGGGTFDFPYGE